jgi:hypothetical protein
MQWQFEARNAVVMTSMVHTDMVLPEEVSMDELNKLVLALWRWPQKNVCLQQAQT